MPLLHRVGGELANEVAASASRPAPATAPDAASDRARPAPAPRRTPVTRTSVAWTGVWAAAIVAIAFIVFLLQNTTSVKISFLGMHANLPLAAGLLIAMIAGVMLTLILGTARLTQLRHLARRRWQETRR